MVFVFTILSRNVGEFKPSCFEAKGCTNLWRLCHFEGRMDVFVVYFQRIITKK